jgi:hypothetical protein
VNGGARQPALLVASDFLCATVALLIAYQLRFHVYPTYIPGGEPPDPGHYALAAPVAASVVVVIFGLMGVYRSRRGVQFLDEWPRWSCPP